MSLANEYFKDRKRLKIRCDGTFLVPLSNKKIGSK